MNLIFSITNHFYCIIQGTEGFEKHMDHLMELGEYMVKKMKAMSEKFYLILEPEMMNVSFWYVPTRLRKIPHNAERVKILGQVIYVHDYIT